MTDSILFLDHATALGGAEHSLLLLMAQLLEDSDSLWRLHLACPPGDLSKAAKRLGIPVHEVDMPRLRRSPQSPLHWQQTARSIASVAKRVDAAIIHSNTVRASIYGALAARISHRPFLWHMRDFWLSETAPAHPGFDDWGKRFLCAASTRVIANSLATASHLPCSRKTEVVYNGIRIERYNPALKNGETFRREWGIPLSVPIIGMVGRLRPWKGQKAFLQMAALVHRQHHDAQFLIVGGSPFGGSTEYADSVRSQAKQLGIHKVVTFTGHLTDIRPALDAMTIFVHPGAPEPFGLVNIEAMAMQKPVVAFAHGALPEIVTSETGILAHPDEVRSLSGAVLTLLADPDRVVALGQAGSERVARHFTVQKTSTKIEDIYHRILQKS